MTEKKSLVDEIIDHLEFYRDLGVKLVSAEKADSSRRKVSSVGVESKQDLESPKESSKGDPRVISRHSTLFDRIPSVQESLEQIREDLGECLRCKLAQERKNIVFGSGNANADLMFVGEAPGAAEDAQGLPFVGRAGKLLTKIIEAIDIRREDVYICNILKCRPPGNRNPETEEISSCEPFLHRQIASVAPKVICALGAFGAQTLLGTKEPISRLRGYFIDYRGSKLIATYHPAYLLRNPKEKRKVWEDIQKVRDYLLALRSG